MSETPERIWGHIDGDVGSWGRNWVFDDDVEYIRADLVEELEAKLAKALLALERIQGQPDYRLPSPQDIARTTLAELKGEDRG
jgi:hypothetical protein